MTNEERRVAAKAIWMFAVWRNGEQWIGSPERPLKNVQRDILDGKLDDLFAASPEMPEWEDDV